MNEIVEILCPKCHEPERGHMQPFTLEKRSCVLARLYRNCKDPIFCRRPEWCSESNGSLCYSEQKYDRACDD